MLHKLFGRFQWDAPLWARVVGRPFARAARAEFLPQEGICPFDGPPRPSYCLPRIDDRRKHIAVQILEWHVCLGCLRQALNARNGP